MTELSMEILKSVQNQLAALEATVETILEELSNSTPVTAGRRVIPANEVLKAAEAVTHFETLAARLQPLFAATASFAASGPLETSLVNSLWRQQNASGAALTPPQTPASTLHDLVTTLTELLPIKISSSSTAAAAAAAAEPCQLQIQYKDVFYATVLLDSPGIGSIMPSPSFIQVGSSPQIESTSALFRQLTASATAAMLHFRQRETREGGSALELLLVWLAGCAASLRIPKRGRALLEFGDGGVIIPACSEPFENAEWGQLWVAAMLLCN